MTTTSTLSALCLRTKGSGHLMRRTMIRNMGALDRGVRAFVVAPAALGLGG